MRLRFDDIRSEAETLHPDGCRQVSLPSLELFFSPLLPAAAEDRAPAAQVSGDGPLPALAGRDCPADCQLRIVSQQQTETTLGWPLRLIRLQVYRAGSDSPSEERLVAVYQFLRYGAAALARGPALAGQESQLAALFSSGRPEWHDPDSGTVTALWDIWQ